MVKQRKINEFTYALFGETKASGFNEIVVGIAYESRINQKTGWVVELYLTTCEKFFTYFFKREFNSTIVELNKILEKGFRIRKGELYINE